jgi:hypothetical protein
MVVRGVLLYRRARGDSWLGAQPTGTVTAP